MSGSRAANQEVPAGQARRTDAGEVRVTELQATGAAVASNHQGALTSSGIGSRIADCVEAMLTPSLPIFSRRRLGVPFPARSPSPNSSKPDK